MGSAQFHHLAVVLDPLKANLAGGAEAVAHRRTAQQLAQTVLGAVATAQPLTAQASQLAAVEEHLHSRLLGIGQHSAVQ
ncbi:hypothetical protein D3C76_1302200 [compost metagenome]